MTRAVGAAIFGAVSAARHFGERHPAHGHTDAVRGDLAFDLDDAAHAAGRRDRFAHGMRPRGAGKLEGTERGHAQRAALHAVAGAVPRGNVWRSPSGARPRSGAREGSG